MLWLWGLKASLALPSVSRPPRSMALEGKRMQRGPWPEATRLEHPGMQTLEPKVPEVKGSGMVPGLSVLCWGH